MSSPEPGHTLDDPFDRHTALADLRALGRKLDALAAEKGPCPEIDATLAAMKQLHARITADLAAATP
ncbi:hypothetical protein LN042_15555 [Kitasatospora sp. RB6PN24]|uniref:hypothetical protein n=1 Tax=Kitasatospora humi TaxID=2893891 RepID=UPI001E5E6C63|nr:hypothetical protein [Kitasatospora humi]MCC9308486.1 hypothetical protein [Kitasatospora humi]